MKKSTSLIIGGVLAALAVCFVVYAAGHPEASFPWSNWITFMLYGAYVWLLMKFLVDIPFLSAKRKEKAAAICFPLLVTSVWRLFSF